MPRSVTGSANDETSARQVSVDESHNHDNEGGARSQASRTKYLFEGT